MVAPSSATWTAAFGIWTEPRSPNTSSRTPSFLWADHILFGTDTPYASADGEGNGKVTIASINALPIPPDQQEQILGCNLRKLLDL